MGTQSPAAYRPSEQQVRVRERELKGGGSRGVDTVMLVSLCWQTCKSSWPRTIHVPNRLSSTARVRLHSPERVPPFTLRCSTNGRTARCVVVGSHIQVLDEDSQCRLKIPQFLR